MLHLLLTMRVLPSDYPDLWALAFDVPSADTSQGSRDEALGKALLTLGESRPHDLVLILTGNTHSFEAPMFGYKPMASYLPADRSLSLEPPLNTNSSTSLRRAPSAMRIPTLLASAGTPGTPSHHKCPRTPAEAPAQQTHPRRIRANRRDAIESVTIFAIVFSPNSTCALLIAAHRAAQPGNRAQSRQASALKSVL